MVLHGLQSIDQISLIETKQRASYVIVRSRCALARSVLGLCMTNWLASILSCFAMARRLPRFDPFQTRDVVSLGIQPMLRLLCFRGQETVVGTDLAPANYIAIQLHRLQCRALSTLFYDSLYSTVFIGGVWLSSILWLHVLSSL